MNQNFKFKNSIVAKKWPSDDYETAGWDDTDVFVSKYDVKQWDDDSEKSHT